MIHMFCPIGCQIIIWFANCLAVVFFFAWSCTHQQRSKAHKAVRDNRTYGHCYQFLMHCPMAWDSQSMAATPCLLTDREHY